MSAFTDAPSGVLWGVNDSVWEFLYGLDKVYPVSWWPPMAAVRELATKVKNLKKAAPERMEEPFAHCDLRKYVLHAALSLHFSLCLSGSCPPSARMQSRSS